MWVRSSTRRFPLFLHTQPTLLVGKANNINATAQAQLFHRTRLVRLDRFETDAQEGGDFLVAIALRNEAQDARLALAESGRHFLLRSRTLADHRLLGDPWIEVHPARTHSSDGVDQFVSSGALEDIPGSAGVQKSAQVLVIF